MDEDFIAGYEKCLEDIEELKKPKKNEYGFIPVFGPQISPFGGIGTTPPPQEIIKFPPQDLLPLNLPPNRVPLHGCTHCNYPGCQKWSCPICHPHDHRHTYPPPRKIRPHPDVWPPHKRHPDAYPPYGGHPTWVYK